MKEILEKLPICTYKKNALKFDKTTEISDGEYVIVRNKMDDFSLYTEEMFATVQKKLFEASLENTEKKNMLRYVLTIADLVSIKSGKMKLTDRYTSYVYSEAFYIIKCNGYIRLIGSMNEEIKEQDLIEMFLLK